MSLAYFTQQEQANDIMLIFLYGWVIFHGIYLYHIFFIHLTVVSTVWLLWCELQ
jgi:hypothetical protein